jgi:hypothetical protein
LPCAHRKDKSRAGVRPGVRDDVCSGCQPPHVHADGSGVNADRVDGVRLRIYTPRSQRAVVVEHVCVDATMSIAASAGRDGPLRAWHPTVL